MEDPQGMEIVDLDSDDEDKNEKTEEMRSHAKEVVEEVETIGPEEGDLGQ